MERIEVNDETVILVSPIDKDGLMTMRWEGDASAVLGLYERLQLMKALVGQWGSDS